MESNKEPLVRQRDETAPAECPFGHVQRIVTAGQGGVANVHVVKVSQGLRHLHTAYDEVYYVLSGRGKITLDEKASLLRPGSVVVIPAGVPHALEAEPEQEIEFIIFGTPAVSIDDERAKPRKV